jgi:formiminotetrahydrofolate cyclodeaminase
MQEILALSVNEFVARTAGKEPTPGGGSVSALVGALAASLGSMALEYTVGKKAYATYEGELREALGQFHTASAMLQELIREDIAAYEALSAMLKLPAEARLAHPDYTATVVAAIRAPQAAAGFAMNVLVRCASLLEKTNKFLVSDLGIAAVYAHATVHASELNVRVNLPLLPNQEEAAALKKEMYELSVKADGVYGDFRNELLRRL